MGEAQAGFIHIGERDSHAFRGKSERHRAPEAACRAGHRSHLSAELGHRHECHSMEAPPTMIKVSMNRTCSLAPRRVTSQAATALPGMLARPITTPVENAC